MQIKCEKYFYTNYYPLHYYLQKQNGVGDQSFTLKFLMNKKKKCHHQDLAKPFSQIFHSQPQKSKRRP